MKHIQKESHGIFYGITSSIIVSFMAVCIKWGRELPPETIVFFRFATGLPIYLFLAHKHNIHFSMKEVPQHLIRGIAGFLAIYLFVYAIQFIPLANALTLTSTVPLFMPFLVMLRLRQLVSKWRFIAAGIGFLGVAILLHPKGSSFLEWGSILALAGGLCSAIALLEMRLLAKQESSLKILLYYFTLSSFLGIYPMILTWKPISHLKDWGILLTIGALSTLFQHLLTKTYTHLPATKASIFNYLTVILGGLAGWIFFHEILHTLVLIGIALIICGAILAILDKTPPKPIKKI